MFYIDSTGDQFPVNSEIDGNSTWENLTVTKKMGSRMSLKKEMARYICRKKHVRRLTNSLLKQVLAKAKKLRKSVEKRERYLSKQLLKEADRYMEKA